METKWLTHPQSFRGFSYESSWVLELELSPPQKNHNKKKKKKVEHKVNTIGDHHMIFSKNDRFPR